MTRRTTEGKRALSLTPERVVMPLQSENYVPSKISKCYESRRLLLTTTAPGAGRHLRLCQNEPLCVGPKNDQLVISETSFFNSVAHFGIKAIG